jgi:hypothetical protein
MNEKLELYGYLSKHVHYTRIWKVENDMLRYYSFDWSSLPQVITELFMKQCTSSLPAQDVSGRRPARSTGRRGIHSAIRFFFRFHMHWIFVIWTVNDIKILVSNWIYIIVTMDFNLSLGYVHLRNIVLLRYNVTFMENEFRWGNIES